MSIRAGWSTSALGDDGLIKATRKSCTCTPRLSNQPPTLPRCSHLRISVFQTLQTRSKSMTVGRILRSSTGCFDVCKYRHSEWKCRNKLLVSAKTLDRTSLGDAISRSWSAPSLSSCSTKSVIVIDASVRHRQLPIPATRRRLTYSKRIPASAAIDSLCDDTLGCAVFCMEICEVKQCIETGTSSVTDDGAKTVDSPK